MKVTLSDIAEETGFSISTVSRTLRGQGKISKQNERLILEAAKRLNYPLQNNSGTHLNREDLFVALLTGFHTGEFYASFFEGFIKAGKVKNLDVSMFNAPSEVDEICSLIKRLRNSGYSSAVLMVPALHRGDYQQILEQTPSDFPLISCSNIIHPVLDTVTFDAYRGASLVADHFAERGYKTVGFIEGPADKPEARYRKNGFIDTVKHASNVEFIWSFPGEYMVKSGIKAFENFEKSEQKPRAVFAADDATALGFMESARAKGYKFPEDIALAGYDNLPMCEYHFPKLTSVNTNYEKLAEITLDVLMERLFNSVPHQGLVSMVPVDLVVRHSS